MMLVEKLKDALAMKGLSKEQTKHYEYLLNRANARAKELHARKRTRRQMAQASRRANRG